VLSEHIVAGSIPPDERINAGELARQFGVSPTPVREALARLESDGLVEKLPLRGYRTTDLLDARELAELFELRLLLEPGTAGSAASRRTDEHVASLQQEIAIARAALGTADAYRTLSQHDMRLHQIVFAAAANETVRSAYDRTHCHLHTFRLGYPGTFVDGTIDEHAEIVDAIAAGDPDRAAAAMRAHVEHSRDRIMHVFD
jgi:DNA-binding GntR family transcriptional regulator